VNSLLVSNYTPEASSELSVLGFYYMFNIALVSISVAMTVCVLNFHFRGHKSSRLPNWLKVLLKIKHKIHDNSELLEEDSDYSNKIKFLKRNNCVYNIPSKIFSM